MGNGKLPIRYGHFRGSDGSMTRSAIAIWGIMEELDMQIETGIGFQNLRSMLNEWVGDKMRQGRSGRVSRRYRGAQLPEIQRENDNEPEIQSDGNTAISRNESDLPVDNL